ERRFGNRRHSGATAAARRYR
ncbi:putative phage integrase, partial [Serratia symbiotica str. Tucson]